jgi:hypothetical protein
MNRYIVEGEWSGHHSGQRRIVHREVIKPTKQWLPNLLNLRSIRYTDGTLLYITGAKLCRVSALSRNLDTSLSSGMRCILANHITK